MEYKPKSGYPTQGEEATHTSIADFLGDRLADIQELGISKEQPYLIDDIRSQILHAYQRLEAAVTTPEEIDDFGKAITEYEHLMQEFTPEHIDQHELKSVNK